MVNKCTVHLIVNYISKVCLSFIYMQHKHMVYAEFNIHHYLALDINENNNAYSAPMRHEVWNVDHTMIMLGIYLSCNKFSHLDVQHHHYSEHDTICLSIFLPWIFYYNFLDKWHHFAVLFCQMVLKLLG